MKQFIIVSVAPVKATIKEHTCESCQKTIKIGNSCTVVKGYNYGKFGREYSSRYFHERHVRPYRDGECESNKGIQLQ